MLRCFLQLLHVPLLLLRQRFGDVTIVVLHELKKLLTERKLGSWFGDAVLDVLYDGIANNSIGNMSGNPMQVQAMNAAPVMDLGAVSLPTPRTPSRQPFAAPAPDAGAHTASLSEEFGLVLD